VFTDTVNLTVFGGTGPTGRELTRLALADGHRVTAVVRNPAALPNPPAGLTVRTGDVLDAASLASCLDGADAVLSALGSRAGRGPTTVYSTGIEHILEAMHAAGVRRLVALTAIPVAPREQRSRSQRMLDRVLHAVFGRSYDDMARMEQRLRASDVDWTVIRPPRLTSKPATGRYRTAVNTALPGGLSITRADLARAMLATLDEPATVRAAVAVAN
jgi:putative NADH-flavin reductase